MAIHLDSPYQNASGRWLRGNLHTHSTRSDGKQSPQEMIRRYAEAGYDFLALSDHDVLADYSGLDSCGLALLPCNEVSGGAPHVLHLGARAQVTSGRDHQKLLDDLNAAGGFAILCHPNWEMDFNHYPYELLATLKGYAGIEIFNGVVLDLDGSHLATDKWDRLLSAGRKVWGFANDDAHRVEQALRGWNMVAAADQSPGAILEALKNGRFYASSGVTIERIASDGPNLFVSAPDAHQIALFGFNGKRLVISDGNELRFDVSEVAGPYIRIECYGLGSRMAWSQPMWIREGLWENQAKRLAELGAMTKSTLHALRADRAPSLSGQMSDPLWKQAEVFDRFISLSDGTPAPVKTEVRAILHDRTLYVALRCQEPELEKLKTDERAAIWSTDSVEVFLDTEGKGLSCYHMAVNAAGRTVAACRGPKQGPNPQVVSRVGRYAEGGGWCAELAIPLDASDGPTEPGRRWGFHLCRNRFPQRGNYVWSWVGHTNHNRDQYASLLL